MNVAEVIAKVQKLRRLATSSNVHEAAAAAAAADRLIQEHNLAEAQLEAEGHEGGERAGEDDDPLFVYGPRAASWQVNLVVRLSKHYGCAGYQQSRFDVRTQRTVWVQKVIGRPSDIATVRYMVAWLTHEIERLARGHKGEGRAWLNSFRHGAVHGVCQAMADERKAVQQEAQRAGASAAIVVVNARLDLATEERDRLHPDLKKSHTAGATNAGGYAAGERAGRNIHRGGQLAAGAGRALKAGGT